MIKKWLKNYFLIGLVLILVTTSVCSFTLLKNNLDQADSKRKFESIYVNTTIDYIIPSPSREQLGELEGSYGIETVTPYFQTKTRVTAGSESINSDVLVFPFADKMENTPYNSERVIDGSDKFEGGDAIVDFTYAQKNDIGIGDSIVVAIGENSFEFTIVAVSETNTYCENGSVAVVLSADDAAILDDADLSYSAAYVQASDLNICEEYLLSDYVPLGRLKDRDMFSSDESYNEHVENFYDTDWSKEVTNCKANYDLESYKYDNINKSIITNCIIYAVIIGVVILVYNLVLLLNSSAKKFMQAFLVKGNGKVSKISNHYISGLLFDAVIYVLSISGFYYLLARNREMPYLSSNLTNVVIPATGVIIVSIIMIVISASFVKSNYRINK